MKPKSLLSIVIGLISLVVVYVLVGKVVNHYRPPGAMTVIEAQAMDMNAMSAATPIGSIPVATEEVTLRSFAPSVTYTGSVVAFNDSEVYPHVTGTLTALLVYPGDRVRAGQIVARLDSAELSSKANEASAGRIAMQHDIIIAGEEQRMAEAQKRSSKAKADAMRMGQRDAEAQVSVAKSMLEQAEREQDSAQISITDAEANVTAVRADVDYWRAEIIREEKLFQAKAVSRDEYEKEKAQSKTADAKLSQALTGVREKKSMYAVAKSRVQQAEANIASTQARLQQSRSGIQVALADLAAAAISVQENRHKVLHRTALANQAVAQERTANIVRGYTEIRATQDGVVTERMVSPGTLVQPGMSLLKIKSDSLVRLQANVAESDLAGVHIGSSVVVTKPSDPRFRLQTRLSSIFNSANAQTRTVTVEALTPNAGHRLLSGEYIAMEIQTAAPLQVLSVPLEAVSRDLDQKPFVWTLAVAAQQNGKTIYTCVMHPEVISEKPGKCPKCSMELTQKNKSGKFIAHRTFVTLGTSDGRRQVVESGLEQGQQVVTHGQENLNEDDPITPVPWGGSGPKSLPETTGEMPKMPGMNMGGKDQGSMGGMKMGDDHTQAVGAVPNKSSEKVTAKTIYTCPMHPEIHAEKPGDCPKCGMKLVPAKSAIKMNEMSGLGT